MYQTSDHEYFSLLPVNLWIAVLKPGVAKYKVLFSQARDHKKHPFWVEIVLENNVHYFWDLACFVRKPVHIEHQYGVGDILSVDPFSADEVLVNETTSCSTV